MKSLTEWPIKTLGKISKITNADSNELCDLGFIEGAEVEVLQHTPFNGPIVVRVECSVYALRKDEAQWIRIISL